MSGIDLTGRTAIVTGATRGIGLATAKTLAGAGVNVVVTSRSQESADAAAAEIGHGAVGMVGHAADEQAAESVVSATVERFGDLHILVNNAGTNPSYGNVIDQDQSRVAKTMEVNFWAPILWTSKAAKLGMKEHGVVVNVASIGGLVPEPNIGVYNASKAALLQITKQLALELGPRIRVVAVAPGIVKTKLASALWEGNEGILSSRSAAGRIGEPDDVASAVRFLVSDAASWITGTHLLIDGGHTIGDRAVFQNAEAAAH